MNALTETFGDSLVVLAFPCNQFGHQTNESDQELLSTLKHVRPGGGYEPNFPVFSKLAVNGEDEDALFTYLKAALPVPAGMCPSPLPPVRNSFAAPCTPTLTPRHTIAPSRRRQGWSGRGPHLRQRARSAVPVDAHPSHGHHLEL